MKYYISIFFILTFTQVHAQTCTVNAGSDLSICSGESANLNGSGTGIEYHWQSNAGLTDTNNINPLVTPTSTTTYVLQSDFTTSINLITNPDFSAGNVGFTSGYIFSPFTNHSVGEYWIATGPQIPSWNPGMAACVDHTNSIGKMMIFNGSIVPDIPLWCQTVSINPNTKYVLTCWLQSITTPSPAQLQFSINGAPIGNILTASLTTCTWQQFYFIWNSGNDTSATICIVNQNTIGGANDFAIDDIGFSPLCTAYDSVTVTVNPIEHSDNPQSICSGDTYTFNSHSYSSTGIYYDTLAGIYGCDSIIITQLTVNPVYNTSNPQTICAGQTYTFNSHSYTVVGTYYDTLSTISGCDSIIITTLNINSLPVLTFSHPDDVCIDAPIQILNYATPAGGTYSGTGVTNNSFNPEEALAGKHQLTYSYTDPVTSCINTISEYITVYPLPVINFSIEPKTSILEYAKITFTDSTPGAVSWLWNFGDGMEAQFNQGVHEYNDTGTYQIILTVVDNFGCKNVSEDFVTIDREFKFYIPNSFTPNDDGINDLFFGTGVGIKDYNMRIFNRWGLLIFETNEINNPWNGKNFPNNIYVYKITLRDYNGSTHDYTGRLSLVR